MTRPHSSIAIGAVALAASLLCFASPALADNEPREHDSGFYVRLNLGFAWGASGEQSARMSYPNADGMLPVAVRHRGFGVFYQWELGWTVADDVAVHVNVGLLSLATRGSQMFLREDLIEGVPDSNSVSATQNGTPWVAPLIGLGTTVWLPENNRSVGGSLVVAMPVLGSLYREPRPLFGAQFQYNEEAWLGNRWSGGIGLRAAYLRGSAGAGHNQLGFLAAPLTLSFN